jgi:hypothetical protein
MIQPATKRFPLFAGHETFLRRHLVITWISGAGHAAIEQRQCRFGSQ